MTNKTYNYSNHSIIAASMKMHNTTRTEIKFTLIDYNVLCLVKSFYESGQSFYMSNETIADQLLSCEKTVRNSINRLCKAGLLRKEKAKNGRCLIYNDSAVKKFIAEMQYETYVR